MRKLVALVIFPVLLLCNSVLYGQKGDPPTTEIWDPVPPMVTPGDCGSAPSDAIVLFDGKDLTQWVDDKGNDAGWEVKDGYVTVTPLKGAIHSRKSFGDCQLHIEWRTPVIVKGESQGRGNSGIFLQEKYEVQVLDNYDNLTYSNGQAGSIYKQSIPLVNVCKKPGEWQTYDIIYQAPRFSDNGRVAIPARVTVIQNGVLVQNNVVIWGPTEYIGSPNYKAHGKAPLSLQDHGNAVSYRNIWIREL
jgi:hypothetical protein